MNFFFGGGGSPFGDMPHNMGGSDEGLDTDNEKLYNILGISKDAGAQDIKKAYRKLAMQKHPDRGGDPEEVIFLLFSFFSFIFLIKRGA